MHRRAQRVQLILFLGAVFVPCALLVALSVRIIAQDRELQERRRVDERRRVVSDAGKALAAALESIKAGEIRTELDSGQHYRHSATVLVAWADHDRLLLPWDRERDPVGSRIRKSVADPAFGPVIRACEQPREPALMDACYQRALQTARDSLQEAYARWLWAQALGEGGRAAQAAKLYGDLLNADPRIADEDGIPLKLYAAQALVSGGAGRRQIIDGVESALAARPWMATLAYMLVDEIIRRLAHGSPNDEDRRAIEELRRKAEAQSATAAQGEALKDDFPRLGGLLMRRPRTTWITYGTDDLWLVSAAGEADDSAAIVAVRGRQVFGPLEASGTLRFTDSRDPQGEPLGEAFPGLKVVTAAAAAGAVAANADIQLPQLYLSLWLVVAATMFVAYLVWRDLKREMRLSEMRAQFVSSVTHELKTPLTAIRMFAETLQMGRCADPDTQAEYLGTIVSESERLSRLVDGVLMFSKAEQGKRTYRLRPVSPAEVVRDAARALEYPLSQHGFRLHMQVEEGLPLVHADRDALEQAILNLLSNAMKFSGDARDIELGLGRSNGEIVVRVADRGIGIAPEEQSRIFDKFYRAPTRENQLIPGTGLGLALVAQIVKAHGGRVEVESAPGKGSTFRLRLPVEPAGQGGQEGIE